MASPSPPVAQIYDLVAGFNSNAYHSRSRIAPVASLATHLIGISLAGQFHERTSTDCGNARVELRTRV
jgi:hypothetical protein